jgi:hypothetical protein
MRSTCSLVTQQVLIEVRRGTTVLVLRLQGGEHAPRFTASF